MGSRPRKSKPSRRKPADASKAAPVRPDLSEILGHFGEATLLLEVAIRSLRYLHEPAGPLVDFEPAPCSPELKVLELLKTMLGDVHEEIDRACYPRPGAQA
jgi:hypothetical protein